MVFIVEHPVEGKISLESWMERQERHIPHHIDQMRENYDFGSRRIRRENRLAAQGELLAAQISLSVGTC